MFDEKIVHSYVIRNKNGLCAPNNVICYYYCLDHISYNFEKQVSEGTWPDITSYIFYDNNFAFL